MTYTPHTWSATPRYASSAAGLNRLEQGVADAHTLAGQALAGSVIYANATASAVQTAATAAGSAGGGLVVIRRGDITMASGDPAITVPAGVILDGISPGAVRFLVAPRSDAPISSTGTQGSIVLLTANANRKDNFLTVASTAGLAVGDVLLLGSNAAQNGNPITTQQKGEMVRVKTVDSGTALTIWGQLRDDYATADSAGIRKLTLNRGVGLRNLSIINSNPYGGSNPLAKFVRCRDVTVDNVTMQGGDSTGLMLEGVLGFSVTGSTFEDFADRESTSFFGYGVCAFGAVQDGRVVGNHFRRLRNGFGTTGLSGVWGAARNITVAGNTASETTAAALSTHPGAEDVTFVGNTVSGSTHAGISLGGPRCKALDNSISNCSLGILVRGANAHGAVVAGNSITNIGGTHTGSGDLAAPTTNAQGYAIRVEGGVNGVTVTRNHIEQILRAAVWVGSDTGASVTCRRLRVIKNDMISIGQVGSSNNGVWFTSNVTQIHESLIEGNLAVGYATAITGVVGSSGQVGDFIRLDFAGAVQTNGLRVLDNTVISKAAGAAILGGADAASANIQQLGTRDL